MNNETPGRPWYQAVLQRSGFIVVGLLSLGGALGAVVYATALITIRLAFAGTFVAVVLLLTINLYLRRKPLRWVFTGGKEQYIRRLGPQLIFGLAGVVALLWVGAVMHADPTPDGPKLQLAVGQHELQEGLWQEVIYVVPPGVKAGAFRGTYLPLYLSNFGSKTAEKIKISLTYPAGEPRVSLTRWMRQDTLGEEDAHEVQRRTQSFEGTDFTFFSIDDIDRDHSQLLNEPIELSAGMLDSPLNVARVIAEVSAKDLEPLDYRMVIRCVVAESLPSAYKVQQFILWSDAVARRRGMGFWRYLQLASRFERSTGSILLPEFRPANSSSGSGFLSDAMHDRSSTFSYSPTPLRYAFAGLWDHQ